MLMDAATRLKYFPEKKVVRKSKSATKKQINSIGLVSVPVDYKAFPRTISYSQYALYKSCPRQWYLKYAKRIKKFDSNINLVFGTALHVVLQTYLTECFKGSVSVADKMDFSIMLREQMATEFQNVLAKHNTEFSSPEEMTEYYYDGVAILNYLRSHRREFFNTKTMILLGVELSFHVPVSSEYSSVGIEGHIDISFYDTEESMYYFFDIKTSTRGWKYEKKDPKKLNQLLLYKHFMSVQHNIDIDKIKPIFLIVKRKLIEDSPYPQKRIQWFEPPNSTRTVKKAVKDFEEFVKHCFNPDGSINETNEFPALTGERCFNCNYCPFKNDETLCPISARR